MNACQQKPRWLKAACQALIVSSALITSAAFAEVDISITGNGEVSIAGRANGDFFFGTADVTGNHMSMGLKAWANTRGAGNGTGNPGTNGAGNGTGRRDIIANWGSAYLAISCSEVVVVVFRQNNNGQNIIADLDILPIDNVCGD